MIETHPVLTHQLLDNAIRDDQLVLGREYLRLKLSHLAQRDQHSGKISLPYSNRLNSACVCEVRRFLPISVNSHTCSILTEKSFSMTDFERPNTWCRQFTVSLVRRALLQGHLNQGGLQTARGTGIKGKHLVNSQGLGPSQGRTYLRFSGQYGIR